MATKKKMLQAAAGNSGGGAGLDIDEVFSTYLYEGNGDGSAAQNVQTITNGIDLSGEGGMVWIKGRSHTTDHIINDTVRGAGNALQPNLTDANQTGFYDISQFNSNGFGLDAGGNVNNNGYEYASWTFRKAPKFFDIVTYTGTGSVRTIPHNLGTTVGSIWIKRLDSNNPWIIFHRSNGATGWLSFDTASFATNSEAFNNTMPTDSVFTLGTRDDVNNNGNTYVAYLFAHNDGDGEFGPDGDADVVKCGSYAGNGSSDGPEIDLGFEPQWLLVKRSIGGTSPWQLLDVMRGFTSGSFGDKELQPNASNGENEDERITLLPTGFKPVVNTNDYNASGSTYIYIAIRRGPLAAPESATEVFDVYAGNDSSYKIPTGFVTDLVIGANRSGSNTFIGSRLTNLKAMRTNTTQAEGAGQPFPTDAWQYNDGVKPSFFAASTAAYWLWKRAPGYFDVVAYSGNGTAGRTVSHNLGVAPEMMWVKLRDGGLDWAVYHKDLYNGRLWLNDTNAYTGSSMWNNTLADADNFTVGSSSYVNLSNRPFIAYLFASLDGVSKVGSYTGDGTTDGSKVIDCGFTSGARFVLIKRSNSGGSWYVWDTARGIVAGNDPRLELNSTNAEASFDNVDPHSSGFSVVGSSINNINGGEYIFYAIA